MNKSVEIAIDKMNQADEAAGSSAQRRAIFAKLGKGGFGAGLLGRKPFKRNKAIHRIKLKSGKTLIVNLDNISPTTKRRGSVVKLK